MISPEGYIIENIFDGKGNWMGYRCSAPRAIGEVGKLYPTGKDGKGIEIKPDANESVTNKEFQKA
jgi:hypothetical protein